MPAARGEVESEREDGPSWICSGCAAVLQRGVRRPGRRRGPVSDGGVGGRKACISERGEVVPGREDGSGSEREGRDA